MPSNRLKEPIGDDTTHVGESGIAGLGLFSTRPIRRGELVAAYREAAEPLTPDEWESLYPTLGLPHDAAIAYERGRRTQMLRDASWINPIPSDINPLPLWHEINPVPKWYRLNHSSEPNLKLRRQNDIFEWVAKDDIPANQELSFNYGDVPDEWNTKRKARNRRILT